MDNIEKQITTRYFIVLINFVHYIRETLKVSRTCDPSVFEGFLQVTFAVLHLIFFILQFNISLQNNLRTTRPTWHHRE